MRASRVNASRPGADLRLRTMPRLPRLTALNAGLSVPTAPAIRRVESPPGGSILITSAPMSHSSIAQYGPAITCVTSRTRTPSSALGQPRRFAHMDGSSIETRRHTRGAYCMFQDSDRDPHSCLNLRRRSRSTAPSPRSRSIALKRATR